MAFFIGMERGAAYGVSLAPPRYPQRCATAVRWRYARVVQAVAAMLFRPGYFSYDTGQRNACALTPERNAELRKAEPDARPARLTDTPQGDGMAGHDA